ncbi:ParA family protein [Spirosoma oryzae]|nr:ParA family protein [Spirosoma oryzae]
MNDQEKLQALADSLPAGSPPQVITIASQKGGVGKTTLTMLTATYLYALGMRIMVIDADKPQHSIHKMRLKELNDLNGDAALKAVYDEKGLSPYKIIESSIDEAGNVLPIIIDSGQFDYIFLDLPGTLNVAGMSVLASHIDKLIIPMEQDQKTFASGFETVAFYRSIKPEIPIGLLWNRIKPSESKTFMKAVNDHASMNVGLHILNTVFFDRVTLKRSSSTLHPSDDELLVNFIRELISEGGFLHI